MRNMLFIILLLAACPTGARAQTADELHRLLYQEVIGPYLDFFRAVHSRTLSDSDLDRFNSLFGKRCHITNDFYNGKGATPDFYHPGDYTDDLTSLLANDGNKEHFSSLDIALPTRYNQLYFCHDGGGSTVWLWKSFTYNVGQNTAAPPVAMWVQLRIVKEDDKYKIQSVTPAAQPQDEDGDGILDITPGNVRCDLCSVRGERLTVAPNGCSPQKPAAERVRIVEAPITFRKGWIMSVTGAWPVSFRKTPPVFNSGQKQWDVTNNGSKNGYQLGLSLEYHFADWIGIGAGGLYMMENLDGDALKNGIGDFLRWQGQRRAEVNVQANANQYLLAYSFLSLGYRNKWYGLRLEPTLARAFNSPFADNRVQITTKYDNGHVQTHLPEFKTAGSFWMYGGAVRLEAWLVQNRLGLSLGMRYLTGIPLYATQEVSFLGMAPVLVFKPQQLQSTTAFAGLQVRFGARD